MKQPWRKAADLWREQLGRFLLEQNPDLFALFLRLPGLAAVSREDYGGFAAALFGGSRREADREAARRVTAYYQHLDRYLGGLLGTEEASTTIAVVSVYGFEPARGLTRVAAAATGSRRRGRWRQGADGFVLISGPGFKRGAALSPIEGVDLVPTLLYSLGLPAARDLDGRIVTDAFAPEFLASQPLAFVPSYERIQGRLGDPSPSAAEAPTIEH